MFYQNVWYNPNLSKVYIKYSTLMSLLFSCIIPISFNIHFTRLGAILVAIKNLLFSPSLLQIFPLCFVSNSSDFNTQCSHVFAFTSTCWQSDVCSLFIVLFHTLIILPCPTEVFGLHFGIDYSPCLERDSARESHFDFLCS